MNPVFKIMALWYIVINIVLFVLMGIDKRKAVKNKWRIRESVLLIVALLGGGIGGFIGMRVFHHKSRKWYFHVVFVIGIVLHLVLLWWLLSA